jgi:hypothetical protein
VQETPGAARQSPRRGALFLRRKVAKHEVATESIEREKDVDNNRRREEALYVTYQGCRYGCRVRARAESMTTIKAMRLASLVTTINVLVASGFSIAAIIRPQYLVPPESVPTEASLLLAMYAAARTIPLALFALAAIYKRATTALLILGSLAGAMQLLDAGIGLFEHDLGKCAGPLFIAVLQLFVVYLLHRSVRITPQTQRG